MKSSANNQLCTPSNLKDLPLPQALPYSPRAFFGNNTHKENLETMYVLYMKSTIQSMTQGVNHKVLDNEKVEKMMRQIIKKSYNKGIIRKTTCGDVVDLEMKSLEANELGDISKEAVVGILQGTCEQIRHNFYDPRDAPLMHRDDRYTDEIRDEYKNMWANAQYATMKFFFYAKKMLGKCIHGASEFFFGKLVKWIDENGGSNVFSKMFDFGEAMSSSHRERNKRAIQGTDEEFNERVADFSLFIFPVQQSIIHWTLTAIFAVLTIFQHLATGGALTWAYAGLVGKSVAGDGNLMMWLM